MSDLGANLMAADRHDQAISIADYEALEDGDSEKGCCRIVKECFCGEDTWKDIQLRMWFSLSWLLFALYVTGVTNIVADKRTKNLHLKRLPDLGFEIADKLSPNWAHWDTAADTTVGCTMVLVLLRVMFDSSLQRITILRRVLFLNGCMFLLRSLVVSSTNLPNPFQKCDRIEWGNTFVDAFYVMFHIKSTCADVFYSGHTVNVTLAALTMKEYVYKTNGDWWNWSQVAFVWFCTFVAYYSIVVTNFHYTIDVEIALTIVFMLWDYYHTWIRSPFLMTRMGWRSDFLTWFEGGARRDTSYFDSRDPAFNHSGVLESEEEVANAMVTQQQPEAQQPPV